MSTDKIPSNKEALAIIRGISQAASGMYDGAVDEEGKPIECGLKREEGHPILDSRVMDGFSVRIQGDNLIATYQSDIKLKDVYGTDFESEVDALIEKCISSLKKQYRKITGSSLGLKALGEVDALVQKTSKIRVFVIAKKLYRISGLDNVENKHEPSDEKRLEDSFKSFLDQGGWKKENADPKGQPVYTGKGKVQARKDIHSSFKAE